MPAVLVTAGLVLLLGDGSVRTENLEISSTNFSGLEIQRSLEVNELLELEVGDALALADVGLGKFDGFDSLDMVEGEEVLDIFNRCFVGKAVEEDHLAGFL